MRLDRAGRAVYSPWFFKRGGSRLAGRADKACLTWLVMLGWMGTAAAQTVNCPDGQPADGMSRAGNSAHCLVLRTIVPTGANGANGAHAKVLLVFLHGDSSGRAELPADRGVAFTLAQQLQATTVAVLRPGYKSELGQSSGFNPGRDDDYTAGNVDVLAAALNNLRSHHPGKKILLIGHSGGAAMTGLVASRFPRAADAYLLAACPCDVPPWRQWRRASAGRSGHWPLSLSPQDEVGKIPAGTRIGLVVGNKDDNTLPKFSEAYAASLQARGVTTRVTYALHATHQSVTRSPEFFMVARSLLETLEAAP